MCVARSVSVCVQASASTCALIGDLCAQLTTTTTTATSTAPCCLCADGWMHRELYVCVSNSRRQLKNRASGTQIVRVTHTNSQTCTNLNTVLALCACSCVALLHTQLFAVCCVRYAKKAAVERNHSIINRSIDPSIAKSCAFSEFISVKKVLRFYLRTFVCV